MLPCHHRSEKVDKNHLDRGLDVQRYTSKNEDSYWSMLGKSLLKSSLRSRGWYQTMVTQARGASNVHRILNTLARFPKFAATMQIIPRDGVHRLCTRRCARISIKYSQVDRSLEIADRSGNGSIRSSRRASKVEQSKWTRRRTRRRKRRDKGGWGRETRRFSARRWSKVKSGDSFRDPGGVPSSPGRTRDYGRIAGPHGTRPLAKRSQYVFASAMETDARGLMALRSVARDILLSDSACEQALNDRIGTHQYLRNEFPADAKHSRIVHGYWKRYARLVASTSHRGCVLLRSSVRSVFSRKRETPFGDLPRFCM